MNDIWRLVRCQRAATKRNAAIAAAYLSGMLMRDIARQYGMTRQRVHLIVRAGWQRVSKDQDNAALCKQLAQAAEEIMTLIET